MSDKVNIPKKVLSTEYQNIADIPVDFDNCSDEQKLILLQRVKPNTDQKNNAFLKEMERRMPDMKRG